MLRHQLQVPLLEWQCAKGFSKDYTNRIQCTVFFIISHMHGEVKCFMFLIRNEKVRADVMSAYYCHFLNVILQFILIQSTGNVFILFLLANYKNKVNPLEKMLRLDLFSQSF